MALGGHLRSKPCSRSNSSLNSKKNHMKMKYFFSSLPGHSSSLCWGWLLRVDDLRSGTQNKMTSWKSSKQRWPSWYRARAPSALKLCWSSHCALWAVSDSGVGLNKLTQALKILWKFTMQMCHNPYLSFFFDGKCCRTGSAKLRCWRNPLPDVNEEAEESSELT